MLDKNDEKVIKEIIKGETQDLRSDVKDLKKDVGVLKKDVDSLKNEQRRQGILMEDMNSKMDLILENTVGINEKLKGYNDLKEKVYQNHEIRIKVLEASSKDKN